MAITICYILVALTLDIGPVQDIDLRVPLRLIVTDRHLGMDTCRANIHTQVPCPEAGEQYVFRALCD